MKINRKSDIIDDFINRMRNDVDKQNLLSRGIQINSPILSHLNPINRSKYKLSSRKQSLSKRQSTDTSLTREQSKIFAFSQISDITSSSINTNMRKPAQKIKMKQNSHLSIFSELLTDLIRRVDKNQRQIQKIKKLNREQFYDGIIFGSNQNRSSDFKQIKDLYMLIRDQNIIQSQFNKRINDQITQIKSNISNKTQCQKFYQDKDIRKTNIHIKQLQSSIKNLNITNQLNNRVQQLSKKIEEINDKVKKIQKSAPIASHIVQKSDRVCQNQESMGIRIRISQIIQKQDSLQLICQNVSLYYIDINGYLLDHNKYYLLNQQNKMIQINQDQLLKIKQKCQLIL